MSEEVIEVQDTSLNDVLKGPGAPVVIDEPKATVEEVEEVDETTTETDPAPTAEKAEPEDNLKDQIKAFQTKADDEKRKRQQREQELQALREQMARKEDPDPYSEPAEAIQVAISRVEQKFQNQILNMSENGARNRYKDDFDAMKEHFFEKMVLDHPSLQSEALSQIDPYEFVYRTAKNDMELSQVKELGGIDGLKAKWEKDLRAKLESEFAAKQKELIEQKITASIPGSLSSQRAAGGNQTKVFAGDVPLSKIVGRK